MIIPDLSILPLILLLCVSRAAAAFSGSATTAAATNSENVYLDQSEARYDLDQAAYESPTFWKRVSDHVPMLQDDRLERFRGFCSNLKNEQPGAEVFLDNGQQLLKQYVFPGLDDGVNRQPYPTSAALNKLKRGLKNRVQKTAQRELASLLEHKPLVADDGEGFDAEGNDGDTWQRAAWYGWQFLSLRGAVDYMPKTVAALRSVVRPAHRFVGLARQKEGCTGTVHSDGLNYMLSTLTPLKCPEEPNSCGIIVHGETAAIETNGDPILLDNTFPHQVFNRGTTDRYCLMSEVYHPALTLVEQDALATLFALKDQFTVLELGLAPWGYDDSSLEYALGESGAVNDINFWKDIGYDRKTASSTKQAQRRQPEAMMGSSSSSKKKKGRTRSSSGARSAGAGFGKR